MCLGEQRGEEEIQSEDNPAVALDSGILMAGRMFAPPVSEVGFRGSQRLEIGSLWSAGACSRFRSRQAVDGLYLDVFTFLWSGSARQRLDRRAMCLVGTQERQQAAFAED